MDRGSTVDIAIVGGGATGLISYCHAKKLLPQARIAVFDPSGDWGGGLAYPSENPPLLLNVPMQNMGIFPEDPEGFARWIEKYLPELKNSAHAPFMPRWAYKKYLQQSAGTLNSPQDWVPREITKARRGIGGWFLRDEKGSQWKARFLILATGQKAPAFLSSLEPLPANLKLQCFEYERMSKLRGRGLIVGTGLSAFDVWRVLRAQGNKATLTFVSRHGRTPFAHPTEKPQPFPLGSLVGMTPRQVLRIVRLYSQDEVATVLAAVDQIRPQVQSLWSSWSAKEKRQFLSHLRSRWEVVRHRIPSTIHAEWQGEINRGSIRVRSGRLHSSEMTSQGARVSWIDTKQQNLQSEHFDFVIQATGPQITLPSFLSFNGPRWCADPFQLGYKSHFFGDVWILGPATKGRFWEITAVPEIREQVACAIQEIQRAQAEKTLALQKLLEPWKIHPREAGESYARHFFTASKLALRSALTSLQFGVHAVFPFLFVDNGSNGVRELAVWLMRRRVLSVKRAHRALKRKKPRPLPTRRAA